MHLQACLETYPNPDLGVDEDWIHRQWGVFATEEGTTFRERVIREAHTNPAVFYRTAVVDVQVAGFIHATRHEDKNVLEGLYALDRYHGKGIGPKLMDGAMAFFDPSLPTEFEVAADNGRAISFYKRYGFQEVDGSEHLLAEKIPVITMQREAGTSHALGAEEPQ
jgi:ribosomal protein S18 acetylase RimI-like enzyme